MSDYELSEVEERIPRPYAGWVKGQKKAKKLRGDGEWTKERPLTFLYRDGKMKDLAALAKAYMDGHIDIDDLVYQIPDETNWLSIPCITSSQGAEGRMFYSFWGGVPIMCVEHITGRPVCFVDFFKKCRRDQRHGGCHGSQHNVQENTIHSIALMVELTAAMREYDIGFSGIWGFAKLLEQFIDDAVFAQMPALANLPRAYNPYHIGKIGEHLSKPKRGPLAVAMLETLGTVVGMDKFELYKSMRDWFVTRELDFRLPSLEVQRSPQIVDRITALFAAVTIDDINAKIPPPRPVTPYWDSVARDMDLRESRKRKWEEFEWVPGLEQPEPGVPQWMKDQDAEDKAWKQLARDMPGHNW